MIGRRDPTALPFWADGGLAPAQGVNAPWAAPAGHRLALWPDRVERVEDVCEALAPGGLAGWLDARLPHRHDTLPASAVGRGPLHVLALAYEAGWAADAEARAHLPALPPSGLAVPHLVHMRYPAWLERSQDRPGAPWLLHAVDRAAADRLEAALAAPLEALPSPPAELPPLVDGSTAEAHGAAVERLLAGIHRGDYYQVNLARRLVADGVPGAAVPALYRRLRRDNPAAFGVLWDMGAGRWLASSAPECLFHYEASTHRARSWPIKGTRPRAASPDVDADAALALATSAKDRAEHVMIVDLVRHDLGRVARPGRVRVPTLLAPLTLPTVHHLVSDVVADLRDDATLGEAVAALFPGGSITGAPKVAAMEAIAGCERVQRGYYTGAVGVVDGTGDAQLNLLIRTCQVADGQLVYATGGGIVADSTPAGEWQETCVKAAAVRTSFDALRS